MALSENDLKLKRKKWLQADHFSKKKTSSLQTLSLTIKYSVRLISSVSGRFFIFICTKHSSSGSSALK